jgi:hypothetical protein
MPPYISTPLQKAMLAIGQKMDFCIQEWPWKNLENSGTVLRTRNSSKMGVLVEQA